MNNANIKTTIARSASLEDVLDATQKRRAVAAENNALSIEFSAKKWSVLMKAEPAHSIRMLCRSDL